MGHTISEGFVPAEHRKLVVAAPEPEALLDLIVNHEPPPPFFRWLDRNQT
jgi:hypothetical protein